VNLGSASRHDGTWRWALVGLMGLAALSAGIRVWREPNIGSDALLYLIPIHNLMAGKGYSYLGEPHLLMPPGYGLLAYVVFLAVRDIELSGMIVSAASAVLVIPVVFSIVTRLAGGRAGWIGAFLVTCWPTIVKYAHINYSDLAFTLFLALSARLYLAIVLDTATFLRCLLLGLALGFSCLIRPEGAPVAVLAAASLFVLPRRSPGERGRLRPSIRHLARAAVTGLMIVIVALPYLWFLHRETGRWTLSTKLGVNLLMGEGVVEGDAVLEQRMAEEGERTDPIDLVTYFRGQGSKMGIRIWRNAVMEAGQLVKITLHGLLLLAVVGGFALRRLGPSRAWRVASGAWTLEAILMIAIFVSPLPVYLLFYVWDRYLLPYAVFALAGIAVVAGAWLDAMERESRRSRTVATIPLAAGVAVAVIALLLPIRAPWPSLPAELTRPHAHRGLRAAGLWLAGSGAVIDEITVWAPGKGDVVLFYASGEAEPRGHQSKVLSTMTLEDVVDRMDATSPAYLVVDSHYGSTKPNLWRLWTEAALAERVGLRLVFAAKDVRVFDRQPKGGS
jgi:4-amino-4-deoxy-L-arabinose transferase-like glycosyltransferase